MFKNVHRNEHSPREDKHEFYFLMWAMSVGDWVLLARNLMADIDNVALLLFTTKKLVLLRGIDELIINFLLVPQPPCKVS